MHEDMHLILTDGTEKVPRGGLTQTVCLTSRNQKPTSLVRISVQGDPRDLAPGETPL